MPWIFRSLAPLGAAVMLALAGCQTAPTTPEGATDQTAPAPAEQAAAPAATPPDEPPAAAPAPIPVAVPARQVAFYIAQTHSEPSLTALKMSDGTKLYVQRAPVLTREDISQAQALVDKQGKHFVGLRFTAEGARKLEQASRENMSRWLVLILDGKEAAELSITQPLDRGELAFGVPTARQASTLAARIHGKPLAEPKAEPKAVPKAAPKRVIKHAPKHAPKAKPKPKPKAKPKAKAKPAAKDQTPQ